MERTFLRCAARIPEVACHKDNQLVSDRLQTTCERHGSATYDGLGESKRGTFLLSPIPIAQTYAFHYNWIDAFFSRLDSLSSFPLTLQRSPQRERVIYSRCIHYREASIPNSRGALFRLHVK